MSIVGFHNVSHQYKAIKALDNVSFDINRNQITAIIGKSGSGKSTLIQIINGLIRPTAGNVTVFDQTLDYKRINQTRLNIGYSVQGAGLFPHMNVKENIALLGKITHQPRTNLEKRINLLMNFVSLSTSIQDKYPYQLSGGEQQRVGICRALLLNPPLCLLDEPFAALDPITKNEIYDELLKLQQFEPRTFIMITHDLKDAIKLADYIMVLDKGVIQQYDRKEIVLTKPVNSFVKTFIELQLN